MNDSQAGHAAGQGGRVLVVDDEEKNRRLLADLLTAEGYAVRTASDGKAALQAVPEFQPETIVLDIMMPNIDGVEVCRRLKADPLTASIPILLATALRERCDRLRGLKAGANDFLSKPLDTEEVCSRVKNAVSSKRLHDRLQEAYSDLKQLEKLRDNLTHMIVHDLRSPMMVLSMSFDAIGQQVERLSKSNREIIEMSRDTCQGLIEMVSSLLDVNRMEAGKMQLNRESCDVREIARGAVESMAISARQKNLAMRLAGSTVTCSVDKGLVRRVFINLIANAIKFSREGADVGVQVSLAGSAVRCTVADSGYGIPPEYHQRIFEKFGQVEARKEGKMYSTGLGLTFCKLAVEAHGGQIGVVSAVDKGSTFWFELPVG